MRPEGVEPPLLEPESRVISITLRTQVLNNIIHYTRLPLNLASFNFQVIIFPLFQLLVYNINKFI